MVRRSLASQHETWHCFRHTTALPLARHGHVLRSLGRASGGGSAQGGWGRGCSGLSADVCLCPWSGDRCPLLPEATLTTTTDGGFLQNPGHFSVFICSHMEITTWHVAVQRKRWSSEDTPRQGAPAWSTSLPPAAINPPVRTIPSACSGCATSPVRRSSH